MDNGSQRGQQFHGCSNHWYKAGLPPASSLRKAKIPECSCDNSSESRPSASVDQSADCGLKRESWVDQRYCPANAGAPFVLQDNPPPADEWSGCQAVGFHNPSVWKMQNSFAWSAVRECSDIARVHPRHKAELLLCMQPAKLMKYRIQRCRKMGIGVIGNQLLLQRDDIATLCQCC